MKKVIVYIGLVLLFGCKAKKEITMRQQETIQRICLAKDSMEWKRMASRLQYRKTSVKLLQLSAPDSLCRQYVETIMEIRSEDEQHDTDTIITTLQSDSREVVIAERKKDEKQRAELKKGYSPLLILGVLFLVVLGTFGLWIKKKCSL